MPRKFRYTADRRIVNAILIPLLRLGIAPRVYFLLTVVGRKTGRPHSVPVTLVTEASHRWLVAPYGVVDWVKNARVAGTVRLSRGNTGSTYRVRELPPCEAAPILRRYLQAFPITRPYFSVRPDAPVDEFTVEAKTRPVFELQLLPLPRKA